MENNMSALTRDQLVDGTIRSTLAMPDDLAWTDADLERSLNETLALRSSGAVWVFAYGSLIWDPLITSDAHHNATLDGWHRSFCIRSISARGSQSKPGRVLALEAGGQVQGVAFRVPDHLIVDELRLLWAREMGSGVYRPIWTRATLDNGETVEAITFIANPHQVLYEQDSSAQRVAEVAASAVGVFGPNAEYVYALDRALATRNLNDSYVIEVVRRLRQSSVV
jgi:glutathione-specific gamma-glutamylcyclotransferase